MEYFGGNWWWWRFLSSFNSVYFLSRPQRSPSAWKIDSGLLLDIFRNILQFLWINLKSIFTIDWSCSFRVGSFKPSTLVRIIRDPKCMLTTQFSPTQMARDWCPFYSKCLNLIMIELTFFASKIGWREDIHANAQSAKPFTSQGYKMVRLPVADPKMFGRRTSRLMSSW